MRLSAPGQPHLTYCTNIHPGETWAEVRANLERHVTAVAARVRRGGSFGVGLRLSAVAAAALDDPVELDGLRALLTAHDLYVFTVNGFPYGPFHGRAVKERVYRPDWLEDERLAYTDRLANLVAALLPDEPGLEGSVSTVPGAFRPRVGSVADEEQIARRLLRHVATLHALRERTGKRVALAIEPEPACLLETVGDTVRFFEERLFSPEAVATVARLSGLGRSDAEATLREHLGLCWDACHMAVEFEEPRAGLAAVRRAGIRIVKIQLSAGLRVPDASDAAALAALRPFAEPVYLHQVVARRGAALTRWTDLPEALDAGGGRPPGGEWRVHFHVPLFRERLGVFGNTQEDLRALLAVCRREPVAPHLEVETYTWEVLPEEYRRDGIVADVARELAWVMEQLAAPEPGP